MDPENRQISILVVEDQQELLELIGDMLTASGFRVTTAENGELACGAIKQNRFDLILSDMRMPVMNGMELLKWCHTNSPTPFIFMTGFAPSFTAQETQDLGTPAFILKPFERKELLAAIKSSLVKK